MDGGFISVKHTVSLANCWGRRGILESQPLDLNRRPWLYHHKSKGGYALTVVGSRSDGPDHKLRRGRRSTNLRRSDRTGRCRFGWMKGYTCSNLIHTLQIGRPHDLLLPPHLVAVILPFAGHPPWRRHQQVLMAPAILHGHNTSLHRRSSNFHRAPKLATGQRGKAR
jgi:hypothetical protein